MPEKHSVFISHSSTDKPVVRDFIRHFPSWTRSWIDEKELDFGASIAEQIQSAISKDVTFVLVFISDAATQSEWVRKEVSWALDKEDADQRIIVIPILLPAADDTALAELDIGDKLAFKISGNSEHQFRSDALELSRRIANLSNQIQDNLGNSTLSFQTALDAAKIDDRWLRYLFAFYIGLLVASAAGGAKTFDVGLGASAAVTVISFAFTFLISDCVHEYFGAAAAKNFIWPGFWALVLAAMFMWIFVAVPPNASFTHQKAYATVLEPPMGFVIAGLTAYIASQWCNIIIFRFLRRRFTRILAWGSRNPVSTLLSQAIDTLIFITLAFSVLPRILPSGDFSPRPIDDLPMLMVGQYVLKCLVALISWPCFVAIVRVMKQGDLRPPQ